MGRRAMVLSLDGRLVGRKMRTVTPVSRLMVMSLEAVSFPGDGEGSGSTIGYSKLRVQEPSGLIERLRCLYASNAGTGSRDMVLKSEL